MHARVQSASLTETLGIRVTEDERKGFELRAEEAGLSLSEWCRQLLLTGLAASPETRLILSEVLSIRRMFLSLALDQAKGHRLTESRLDELAKHAEAAKFALADNRILTFRKQEAHG